MSGCDHNLLSSHCYPKCKKEAVLLTVKTQNEVMLPDADCSERVGNTLTSVTESGMLANYGHLVMHEHTACHTTQTAQTQRVTRVSHLRIKAESGGDSDEVPVTVA